MVDALRRKFGLSEMIDVYNFLDLRIVRDRVARAITMSQVVYVDKILARFQLSGSTAQLPMRTDLYLDKAPEEAQNEASSFPFRELVGALMYLAVTARLDIMYSVSQLARCFAYYSDVHWKAAKQMAHYLSRPRTRALVYGTMGGAPDDTVGGYTDADWAGTRTAASLPEDLCSFTVVLHSRKAASPIQWWLHQARRRNTSQRHKVCARLCGCASCLPTFFC